MQQTTCSAKWHHATSSLEANGVKITRHTSADNPYTIVYFYIFVYVHDRPSCLERIRFEELFLRYVVIDRFRLRVIGASCSHATPSTLMRTTDTRLSGRTFFVHFRYFKKVNAWGIHTQYTHLFAQKATPKSPRVHLEQATC